MGPNILHICCLLTKRWNKLVFQRDRYCCEFTVSLNSYGPIIPWDDIAHQTFTFSLCNCLSANNEAAHVPRIACFVCIHGQAGGNVTRLKAKHHEMHQHNCRQCQLPGNKNQVFEPGLWYLNSAYSEFYKEKLKILPNYVMSTSF